MLQVIASDCSAHKQLYAKCYQCVTSNLFSLNCFSIHTYIRQTHNHSAYIAIIAFIANKHALCYHCSWFVGHLVLRRTGRATLVTRVVSRGT